MQKIRVGDSVIVTAGSQKGTTGQIEKIDREQGKVQVTNVQGLTKHMKPRPEFGFDGGRVEMPRWIDASNVAVVDPEDSKATRVRFEKTKDGFERVSARSGKKIVAQSVKKEEPKVEEGPKPTAKTPKKIEA